MWNLKKQIELTSKTDRHIDGDQMTASGWGAGRRERGGIEQKGKRTHGHGQYCGDCWGEGGIRGLRVMEKIK